MSASRTLLLALILGTSAVSGCSARSAEGVYRCQDNGQCPSGWYCRTGVETQELFCFRSDGIHDADSARRRPTILEEDGSDSVAGSTGAGQPSSHSDASAAGSGGSMMTRSDAGVAQGPSAAGRENEAGRDGGVEMADCEVEHGGCHALAECNVAAGNRTCTCPSTHVGDGLGADGCRRAIKQIYLGQGLACALTQDGQVFCWGADPLSPVDPKTFLTHPKRVENLEHAAAFGRAFGAQHVCVVMDDGRLRCWGKNDGGQLGDGTLVNRSTPVEVPNLSGVSKLAVTRLTSCALSNTRLYCWGSVMNGIESEQQLTPVLVTSMSGLVDVTMDPYGSNCVVRNDGSGWCWGNNVGGVLGAPSPDPNTMFFYEPTLVQVASDLVQLVLGSLSTCGLLRDSTLRCWGNITGSSAANVITKDVVSGVAAYDVNSSILCTALSNKTLQCWLLMANQLEMLPTLQWDALQVVTDGDSTCALLRDSRVYCWGKNKYGQLGDGTTTDSLTPVQVKGF